MHRNTRIRPRAVVWGLAVAACLSVAAPELGAAADKPNPEPLWNAYPLDQNQSPSAGGSSQNAATTTTSAAPAAAATTQPVTVTETAGDGPPWVLMIVAAAGGALLVVVLLTLQGRRSRRREEARVGAADEWPWLGSSHSNGTGEVRAARLRTATNRAGADFGVRPNRGAERDVEPAANGTASEWVADRDRGVGAERDVGIAPAEGAAAERVAEPQPATEREPVEEAEPVLGPAASDDDAEPEPVLGAVANGAGGSHDVEPMVEATANGVGPDHEGAANGDSRDADFDVVEAAAGPRQRFDRDPATLKPAASRRGPICQVRWSAAAKCLFAVATDANGVEYRIAWSPPIASWTQAGPPDEDSREARAALRVLAKDLRDKGWRPMRAKGDDFDETRWYARRFRFPIVEGDDDPAPWRDGPPQLTERQA